MKDKIKATGMVLGITLSIFAISLGVLATDWVGPTQAPPGGNLPAPLNSSSLAQIKDGALGIEGVLRAYSNLIVDGNVGIGTTVPNSPLHVSKAVSNLVSLAGHTDATLTAIGFTGGVGSGTYRSYIGQVLTLGGTGEIVFGTGNNVTITNLTEKMRIDKDGNVGIGTASPTEKLDVNGNIRIGGTTLVGSGSATTYGSVSIAGSKNSYSGIHFSNTIPDSVLMVRDSDGLSGIWRATGGWSWYFTGDGVLTAGSVPAARVTAGTFPAGMSANAPTQNAHIATKQYVDNAVAGAGGGPGSWTCTTVTASGGRETMTATCPSGYQLITGGCILTAIWDMYYAHPYRNYPSGNSWTCTSYSGSQTIAYARCCK